MSTPAPAPQKTEKAAEKGALYHVLRARDEDGYYEGVGMHIRATNPKAAIRDAANNVPGTYIAVTSRSWKPVKVTVSQETVVKLGGA